MSSTDPGRELRLRGVAEAGNYNKRRLAFPASGPVSEVIGASIAATVHRRDGFTRNVTVGRDTNDLDYTAARGKLRVQFTPDLDVTATLGAVRDRSTVRGVQNLAYGDEYAHNQVFPTNAYDSRIASLVANRRLDARWRLRAFAGYTQFDQLYNLVATAPFQSTAANFLTVINGPPQGLLWDTGELSRNWKTWAPKVSLDWRWRTGLLQYVTYSEGTKSAGYDYRAQGATTNGQPPLQAVLPYDPERARNLETGLKGDWLDRSLRANVAVFYTRFDDVQLTTTDPTQTPPVTRRFNAGQASTRGLEVEAAWLPADGLQIDFNAARVRARLDRFDGAPATVTNIPASSVNPNGLQLRSAPFAGAQLPYAPKLQARLAASWRLPLAGPSAWVANLAVSYQDKSYTDATNNPTVQQPSQTYVNGSLSYTPGGGAWTVTLAGQNLANKRYALSPGFTPRTTPAIDGSAIYRTTNYNDPRTVSLAVKYEL